MITETQMYWLVSLDNICGGAVAFAVLCGIASMISFFVLIAARTGDADEDMCESAFKWMIRCLIGCCFFITTTIFTPDTKQMAAIIVVPKIVNNQKMQELPDKLLGLGEKWLDQLASKESKEKK